MKKKKNLKQAVDFMEENVVEPITESEPVQKVSQYVDKAKHMAKKEMIEIDDGMMELGESVATMLEAFKNHQEVEKLQKDVKKGASKLKKSAHEVVEDIKDITK